MYDWVLLPTFFGEGSPTKIDVLKRVGTLILSSLLEDLVFVVPIHPVQLRRFVVFVG